MTKLVLTDAFLSIGGNDLSAHVQSVSLNYEAEEQDSTTMGVDTREALGGLKNWSMDVTFAQDFASGTVDAAMFSIVGTQVAVILRAVNTGGVSTTNPNYTGTGLISSYNPIGNSIGDFAVAPVTIKAAGTLTRATS